MFCRVHVHAYILKVCIITDFDFYQTDKPYIYFLTKSRRGHTGFQFIFILVLKSPLFLSKFDVTAIFVARNTVNNAPLTMKHVK